MCCGVITTASTLSKNDSIEELAALAETNVADYF